MSSTREAFTPQRLTISLFDHSDHSVSIMNVVTAFRLSAFVRCNPWPTFALTENSTGSHLVPA